MNLNVKIEARGSKLRAVFYENGERKRITLGLENTPANIKHCERVIVPQIITRLAAGEKGMPSAVDVLETTLGYFISRALKKTEEKKKIQTYRTYSFAAASIIDFFGENTPIISITTSKVEDYISKSEKLGRSSSTIRVYIAFLKIVFKEAIKAKVVFYNEASLADKPKLVRVRKPVRVYNYFQFHRLFDAAHLSGLKIWMALEGLSGMRVGEALALRWSDIDFENNIIHIRQTLVHNSEYNLPKGGKERSIKIMTTLVEFLYTEYKKRGVRDGFVVLNSRGTNYKSSSNILDTWKKHQSSLGFDPQGTHVLRHTFASLALDAGEKKSFVKDILGHSTEALLDSTYGHHVSSPSDYEKLGKVVQI